MRRLRSFVLGGALTCLLAPWGAVAANLDAPVTAHPTVMRLSYKYAANSPPSQMITRWADEIERESRGRMLVKLYPGDSLYVDDIDEHPAPIGNTRYYNVKNGEIEAAITEHFFWFDLTNILPQMAIATRPFAFGDEASLRRFDDSRVAHLLDSDLRGKGVTNIGWLFVASPSAFVSEHRALSTAAAFSGERIRSLGQGMNQSLGALGAKGVHMNGAGVISAALRAGGLDGAYIGAIYNLKKGGLAESSKYLVAAPWTAEYFNMYVNPAWWDKLDPSLKRIILGATHRLEGEFLDFNDAQTSKALEQFRSSPGLTVISMSPQAISTIKSRARMGFDNWFLRESRPDGRELLRLTN